MLRPSSAAIWGSESGCQAYPKLTKQFPQQNTTLAAEEGSYSHEIAECLLSGMEPKVGGGEVYECAKLYADYIKSYNFTDMFHVEHEVHAPQIHENLIGTVDCWVYEKEIDTIFIFDYKYSMRPVDPFENLQCICYAAGILNYLENVNLATTIVITIVQPRAFHKDGPIRKWETTVQYIQQHISKLRDYAEIATSENPPTSTGKHCQYCSARAECPALQKATYNAIDMLDNCVPLHMNQPAASNELINLHHALRSIQARITGVEEMIRSWLDLGVEVPNFELKEIKGREKWAINPEMVVALGEKQGLNLKKELQVLTPTQARKLGVELTDKYTERADSTKKLIYREV